MMKVLLGAYIARRCYLGLAISSVSINCLLFGSVCVLLRDFKRVSPEIQTDGRTVEAPSAEQSKPHGFQVRFWYILHMNTRITALLHDSGVLYNFYDHTRIYRQCAVEHHHAAGAWQLAL